VHFIKLRKFCSLARGSFALGHNEINDGDIICHCYPSFVLQRLSENKWDTLLSARHTPNTNSADGRQRILHPTEREREVAGRRFSRPFITRNEPLIITKDLPLRVTTHMSYLVCVYHFQINNAPTHSRHPLPRRLGSQRTGPLRCYYFGAAIGRCLDSDYVLCFSATQN
jgi:hypothetical protein